jgi:hypothetical protein
MSSLKDEYSLHPLFNQTVAGSGPAELRVQTTVAVLKTILNSSDKVNPKGTRAKKSSKDTTAPSSKAKQDITILPIYSYKDYSPKATTVYTQHEHEANDLVETLRGCVSLFILLSNNASNVLCIAL